ncbi:MAG TPA: TonB-dependent receptor [Vicinamibacterales bacterium]|nr:TonB-dependent receptor [Vicinamibacterales bacterium]
MKSLRVHAMVLIGLMTLTGPAAAQTTGSISGMIKDASGGALPGVVITVQNQDTSAQRTSTSDGSGAYEVALLPPGRYRLTAELSGFRTEDRNDLALQVSQNVRFDVVMGVSAIEESVQVVARAPLIDTRDAAMGQVVDQVKIVELPLNGRNFRDLGLIAPGVQQMTQGNVLQDRGGGLNINGARIYDNNYLLDGFNNNDETTGEIMTFPSADSIQEFKVLGASYGAEYGFSVGGIISLITKSGGARYSGNGFGFYRNDAFDAKNFFATAKAPLDRKQYGGTLGGPLVGKKTFFFGSYERTDLAQGVTLSATVPGDAQRRGDFSGLAAIRDPLTGLPFAGNQIPAARMNPVGVKMLELWPKANASDPLRNFVHNPNLIDDVHVGSLKVDHNQSNANAYSVRYSVFWDTQTNPQSDGFLPLSATDILKQNQHIGGTWTHVYGDRTVQEIRGGYGYIYNGRYRNSKEDWGLTLGIDGTLARAVPAPLALGPPIVNMTGFTGMTANNNPFIRTHKNWQASYVLAQSLGSHSLKFGGEARTQFMALDDWFNPQGQFTFTGRYTGNGLADLLLGYPSQTQTFVGLVQMNQSSWQAGLFVQDEWRLWPRLTLNYGLRYEYQAPDREQDNNYGTFIPELRQSVQVGTNGVSDTIRTAQKLNFAPRAGAVWDISGDGTRALRAGYGVYYSSFIHSLNFSAYRNTPLGRQAVFNASTTAPNISMSDPFPASFGGDTIVTSALARDFPNGRMQRWSLDLQQQLAGDSMASLGYVGSVSTDQTRSFNLNQPVLGPGTVASRRPYQGFGDITMSDGTGSSSYHAMEGKVQRRLSGGLDLLVAYTLSKSIDDGVTSDGGAGNAGTQNSYDRDADRGLSAWDRRHRLVVSGSYAVPFDHLLARNWQASAIWTLTSGAPFTPVLSTDVAGVGSFNTQRPDRIGSGVLSRDQRGPDRWIDTSAFKVPAAGTFGNAGRNVLTGPGTNTVDLSVSRRFVLPRNATVQVRFEMFNALNTTNFLLPNRTADSVQFGRIFAAAPARQGQLGVKFGW